MLLLSHYVLVFFLTFVSSSPSGLTVIHNPLRTGKQQYSGENPYLRDVTLEEQMRKKQYLMLSSISEINLGKTECILKCKPCSQ